MVRADFLPTEPTFCGRVIFINLEVWHLSEEQNVDNDLAGVVDDFEALLDRADRVSIRNDEVVCEALSDAISGPLVGREESWDAGRRESCLVELLNRCVLLVEEVDLAGLNVEGGDDDTLVELIVLVVDIFEEVIQGTVVKESLLVKEALHGGQRPVLPDVSVHKVAPEFASSLDHLFLRSLGPPRHIKCIDGANRDSSDDVVGEVSRVAIVDESPEHTNLPRTVIGTA